MKKYILCMVLGLVFIGCAERVKYIPKIITEETYVPYVPLDIPEPNCNFVVTDEKEGTQAYYLKTIENLLRCIKEQKDVIEIIKKTKEKCNLKK